MSLARRTRHRIVSAAALLAAFLPCEPVRAAGPLLVNGAGEPGVWTASPVTYNPDHGKLGALSNTDALARLAASAAVWTNVATSSVTITAGAQLPVDVTASNWPTYLAAGSCGDGLSPIVFDEDGSITDDLYGVGANNHVIGFAAPACATSVPPVILEGYSVLNGRFLDGVDTSVNPELTPDEFGAVLIHELGHYLGIDHTQVGLAEAADGVGPNDDAIATMFPILINATEELTLNLDDVVSISTLYPEPGFASSFGTITGTISMPNGDPFQGAHVVARNVADPRITAASNVSGARYFPLNFGGPPDPALQGLYEIRGLPPGDYTIEIERVHPSFGGGSSVGPFDVPAALPGPREFWNGANEAGENPPDVPTESEPVSVTAGATTGAIDVVINQNPAPPNDECAAATEILMTPFTDALETTGATTGAFDPLLSCSVIPDQHQKSVWYRFTPPVDGVLRVDTSGSTYDTVAGILTGACGTLAEHACDDQSGPGPTSIVAAVVTAGTPYWIEIASYNAGGGSLAIAVDFTPAASCAAAPLSGCHTPTTSGKSSLTWRGGAKPQVGWKWMPGTAAVSDFGNPLTATGTSYAFCAYDAASQLVAAALAPPGNRCGLGVKDCWRQTSAGFNYKDKDTLPAGLQSIQLKAGSAGRAKIYVKGRGANLAVPALPAAFPLRVQLVNDAGTCWEATYPATGIKRNDAFQLKAKGG